MLETLMKGNEALAEAAVRAGCRYYFGYPITPQTELMEYLARRLPEVGGTFLQAESELAAVNMVYGAAGAGGSVMTSSSGPGISLKQEGISFLASAELPCVIVNVMRGGPGLGTIQPSQGDYFQATRGGGHGDYRVPVLSPASGQETADLAYKAFDMAQRYRTPVILLSDGVIGQMMEPVRLPEEKTGESLKPWVTNGCNGRQRRVIKTLYLDSAQLEAHNLRLQAKYSLISENEALAEAYLLRRCSSGDRGIRDLCPDSANRRGQIEGAGPEGWIIPPCDLVALSGKIPERRGGKSGSRIDRGNECGPDAPGRPALPAIEKHSLLRAHGRSHGLRAGNRSRG